MIRFHAYAIKAAAFLPMAKLAWRAKALVSGKLMFPSYIPHGV